jgi:hypothetical protein
VPLRRHGICRAFSLRAGKRRATIAEDDRQEILGVLRAAAEEWLAEFCGSMKAVMPERAVLSTEELRRAIRDLPIFSVVELGDDAPFSAPSQRELERAREKGLDLATHRACAGGGPTYPVGEIRAGAHLVRDRLFVTSFRIPIGGDLTSMDLDAYLDLCAARGGVTLQGLREVNAASHIPDFGRSAGGSADYTIWCDGTRLPVPIGFEVIGLEREGVGAVPFEKTIDGLYRVEDPGLYRVRAVPNPHQHALPDSVMHLLESNMPTVPFGAHSAMARVFDTTYRGKTAAEAVVSALSSSGIHYTLDPFFAALVSKSGHHATTLLAASGLGHCQYLAFLNAARASRRSSPPASIRRRATVIRLRDLGTTTM